MKQTWFLWYRSFSTDVKSLKSNSREGAPGAFVSLTGRTTSTRVRVSLWNNKFSRSIENCSIANYVLPSGDLLRKSRMAPMNTSPRRVLIRTKKSMVATFLDSFDLNIDPWIFAFLKNVHRLLSTGLRPRGSKRFLILGVTSILTGFPAKSFSFP